MADRADRPPERPEFRDLVPQRFAAEVLTHSWRVTTGKDQAIELFRSYVDPREWRPKRVVALHLGIERLGLGRGSEPAEDHAFE